MSRRAIGSKVLHFGQSVSLLQREPVPEKQCQSRGLGEALLPAAGSSTGSC